MIEALSDCLAEVAYKQVQEAQRQTSPWMQVYFCFPFSFTYYRLIQPLFSMVTLRISGD